MKTQLSVSSTLNPIPLPHCALRPPRCGRQPRASMCRNTCLCLSVLPAPVSCLVIAPSRGLGGHNVFHDILFTRLRAQAVGQGAQGDGKQSELWSTPCTPNPQDLLRLRPQPSELSVTNPSLSASGMDDGKSGCSGDEMEGGRVGGRRRMARGGCGAAGVLCPPIPARRRRLPSPAIPLPPPDRMACQRWERVWRRRGA